MRRRGATVPVALVLSALLVPIPSPVAASPSAGLLPASVQPAAVGAAAVTAPSAPVVMVQPGNGRVTFRWAAAVTHGSAVKAYQVQTRRKSGRSWSSWSAATVGATVRSRTVTVANSTLVEGRVRATSAAGYGAWSAVQQGKAGTPTAPASTTTPGYLKLAIKWGASNGNGSPVSGYQVRRRLSTNGTSWGAWVTKSLGSSARSNSWPVLAAGQHQTQVRAVNRRGAGPWSTARTSCVEGPAVRLDVTVAQGTSPLAARDVTVTARSAGGCRATTYAGEVTFERSLGFGWDIPADAIPTGASNESFDVEGSIPGDYTFTDVDAGRHTFVGGWSTKTAMPWGLFATDTTTVSITGSVRIDVPAEVRITGGHVEAIAAWQSSVYVTPLLNGTRRDPTLHGATIEFYDAGAPDATSLPGTGGLVRHVLPAGGWSIYHPTGGGQGFGYQYTGDGSTGCSSVIVAVLTITATCSSGTLSLPFEGGLQMWLQLGTEADGPAFFCPQFAGADRKRNDASAVDGQVRDWWNVSGGSSITSWCLTPVDDQLTIVDPLNGLPEAVGGDGAFGAFGDEWMLDILSNDVAANHHPLAWSVDHVGPRCVADAAWLGGWHCGFTTGGTTVPSGKTRWFHIVPPTVDPGPIMYITSQPDCGFFRPQDYGPSTGTYDATTGVECAFTEALTTPYVVTDGLHTARGTVSITYDNPGHPDLSSFDTSTRSTMGYEDEGLVVHTDLSASQSIVVPFGATIPIYELKPSPVSTVISFQISVSCPDCEGGIVVGTVNASQPSMAGIDVNEDGLLNVNPDTVVTVRKPVPLVVSGGIGGETSPFDPTITVPPYAPQACTDLSTCGAPVAGEVYESDLYSIGFRTIREVCLQLGGNVTVYGRGGLEGPEAWDCTSVDANDEVAQRTFAPFCTAYYFGIGVGKVGVLSKEPPSTWKCRWSY